MNLSKRDARKLFLQHQGLLRYASFGKGKTAVLNTINRLSYLQIDTISVVQRAHEHILQNRVPNFDETMLNELMIDRSLYEYWSHAASYLPFSNFRFSLPVMDARKKLKSIDTRLARKILQRVRADGPLRSKDFDAPDQFRSGGWWQWKPAKQALEHLFMTGELMVSHRQGFQKVYDLPENVIPSHVNSSMPTTEEWSKFIVLSMIDSLGVATEYDLGYAKGTIQRLTKVAMKEPISEAIDYFCREGGLSEISVEGQTYYCRPSSLEQLPIKVNRRAVQLLSPFDNLIINRLRTRQLFDFDYRLECYLPAKKRKFGYFAMPILYGDTLIGRIDAKIERNTAELIIKNLWLETMMSEQVIRALKLGLEDFMLKIKCNKMKIEKADPKKLLRLFARGEQRQS